MHHVLHDLTSAGDTLQSSSGSPSPWPLFIIELEHCFCRYLSAAYCQTLSLSPSFARAFCPRGQKGMKAKHTFLSAMPNARCGRSWLWLGRCSGSSGRHMNIDFLAQALSCTLPRDCGTLVCLRLSKPLPLPPFPKKPPLVPIPKLALADFSAVLCTPIHCHWLGEGPSGLGAGGGGGGNLSNNMRSDQTGYSMQHLA